MTPVAADQLENAELHLEVDAGGMGHVHLKDARRPLCFHRKLVTADSSTLPASTSLPDGALCPICRRVLEGAGDDTSPCSERSPPREQPRAADM